MVYQEIKHKLAVDIDDTICATNESWTGFLIRRYGNPEGLTPKEIVGKYRYVSCVPYWNFPEAIRLIDELVNSASEKSQLPVVEGALEVLCKHEGVISAYVTGRPESTGPVTRDWLLKAGFPDRPVIGAPSDIGKMNRLEWKARLIESQYPEVGAIIDDSIGLLDHFSPTWPGRLLLYSHSCCDDHRAAACPNWREAGIEIEKLISEWKKEYSV